MDSDCLTEGITKRYYCRGAMFNAFDKRRIYSTVKGTIYAALTNHLRGRVPAMEGDKDKAPNFCSKCRGKNFRAFHGL